MLHDLRFGEQWKNKLGTLTQRKIEIIKAISIKPCNSSAIKTIIHQFGCQKNEY